MKKSTKTNIIAVCTLSVISLLSINVSALDYQKTINVGFNVQDTLTVSLSSPNLIIDDLMPGTASDSNIITVNVLSNNPYGYTLTSNVGNDTTYNTDKLIHASSATATPFSTITAGTTVTDLNSFTNYQWGYSYSTDNGASWITDGGDAGYSGLPLYGVGEATLLEKSSTSAAAGDNIQFKIAAKASDTQLAGEYKNIINFILTGAPEPEPSVTFDDAFAAAGKTKYNNYYKMQDASSSICSAVTQGQTGQLIDTRDNEVYYVAKLADNKCWMVSNLNLAGGTALSADNTDVTSAYISSFTTSNRLTKNGNTIVLPASSTSGFNTANYSYVYNSGNKTNCGASGQNTPCYSYYTWDAATLGSGRSIFTDNANTPQSICPKGWKLPSTYNGSGTAAAATDFRALMIGYGGSDSIQTYDSSTNPTGATMYSNIGPGTTPNFLLAGYYLGGSFFSGGSYGFYWSSTSYPDKNYARNLSVDSTSVLSALNFYRSRGISVRCLFSS